MKYTSPTLSLCSLKHAIERERGRERGREGDGGRGRERGKEIGREDKRCHSRKRNASVLLKSDLTIPADAK